MSQHTNEICGYEDAAGKCEHALARHSDDGYCAGCLDAADTYAEQHVNAGHYFQTRQPSASQDTTPENAEEKENPK